MASSELLQDINDIEVLLSHENVPFEDLNNHIREASIKLQQCKPDLDREVASRLTDMLEEMSSTSVNLRDRDKDTQKCFRAKRPSADKNCSSNDKLNVLTDMFEEDTNINSNASGVGLVLDQLQVSILENTWRSKNPDKLLSSNKENYKKCFPVHEKAEDFLKVPSLDDLLGPMLHKVHGSKAGKSWDKHRQLFTQPLKQIEKLGFQGQLSARMNIVSILYLQQALGALLYQLEHDESNKEVVTDVIKDLFSISTKSLDLAGRCGAFFHLIRRKAAAQDSGLANLKDIQSKVQYLPFDESGVFGKGLESLLEKRKEQEDQLQDLLPELTRKRKIGSDRVGWKSKMARVGTDGSSYNRNNQCSVRSNTKTGGNKLVNYSNSGYNNFQQTDERTFMKERNFKDDHKSSRVGWDSYLNSRKRNYLAGGDDEDEEVKWEYKWVNEEAEDIHGPFTSKEMMEWTEDNFFPDGVFVRKAGSDGQFYNSKRIDFDLYT